MHIHYFNEYFTSQKFFVRAGDWYSCSMTHFHEDLDRSGSEIISETDERKADYTTDDYDESK